MRLAQKLILLFLGLSPAFGLPRCSSETVNGDCEIRINRE
jgi:hypothetical protein